MKMSICCLASVLALAAAALSGCKTNGCCGSCSSKSACLDGSSCAVEGAKASSCCSDSAAKTASACCSEGEKTTTAAAPATGAVNATCPYSGKPAQASLTANYQGKTVAFCCAGCVGKWTNASDADRAALFSRIATN